MENFIARENLLTFLWTVLYTLGAVFLYDGFSKRKNSPFLFWLITFVFVVLKGMALNTPFMAMHSFVKVPFSIVIYALFHRLQYTVAGVFNLYIAVIYYAITCCTENLVFTSGIICRGIYSHEFLFSNFILSLINGLLVLLICFALKRQRIICSARMCTWQWYSIPALLSLCTTLLVFYFGECYERGAISIAPLFVCSIFLTLVQVAALFLVSWMELNSHFREETLSLHTRAQAQQESIEALGIAYAQQRKLTHDFQSHVDVLNSLLAGNSLEEARRHLHELQKFQTDRILLVNTHNATMDALLNQKASVATNRKIDIQFSVNDLSPLVINSTDLTVIISNIMDNAIEACEKLQIADRQIFVKVLLEDDSLFFSVRNRALPVSILPGQLPASTKKDAGLHGFGLENVRATLAKYKALYSLTYTDGWFSFATELPNTLIS